jgi:hypothetical protein
VVGVDVVLLAENPVLALKRILKRRAFALDLFALRSKRIQSLILLLNPLPCFVFAPENASGVWIAGALTSWGGQG